MTKDEIKDSGLLEQYVLGLLDAEELALVEEHIARFPDLKQDIKEIESALHMYAQAMGINPREGLEDQIIESARASGRPGLGSNLSNMVPKTWLWAASIFGVGLLISLFSLFSIKNELSKLQNEFAVSKSDCETLVEDQNKTIELLQKLNNPDTKKLNMSATPGFPETELLFYLNPESKENFIQVKKLPLVAQGEVYQLWSLKDGEAPIPLSTFKGELGDIIPVEFVDNTLTYAITIEPEGGSQSPNLAKLICTVGV